MVLLPVNDDAAPSPTTGGHGAAVQQHAPALFSYRVLPTTPPASLTEHLLLDKVPTFRLRKPGGDPPAAGHVDWASLRRACKEWLAANPMNAALLAWLLCVGVSGGMLVLLLLGLLDGAFPSPAERNHWIEVNNQVLNALFTLMSVYQHPLLCHHLFLLCRWRPRDAADLRAAYCKEGAAAAASPRPRERAHMAVVVALLHLTVLCQYVLCGLYWGYTKRTRPELLEDGFFALGVVAPVAAAAYTLWSPLGRDEQCHELACSDSAASSTPAILSVSIGHVVVEPEWAGGMLDCGGDAATGCLSVSCTFCVFGWNMERLGLGNAWVHAATFALLCFAPLCVLGVAALRVHDYVIGDAVGGAGVLLCACGLLYGGYWRIQMRRKFGLPGNAACCGSTSLTDYGRWLFCWPCALAQEVRTANLYHVDGEVFYSKVANGDNIDSRQPLLAVSTDDHAGSAATDSVSESHASPPDDHHLVVVHHETTMAPPVQVVVVQVEDECSVVLLGDTSNSLVVSSEEDAALSEPNRAMAEDADQSMLSDGSWRAEKVKKLISMVTLVSLLILMYTRGIIL